MDEHTRERIAALKDEIAGLRRSDAIYHKKYQHTLVESLEHIRRMEKMRQILDELATLTWKHTHDAGELD